jgi:dienelactone hydrolase
MRARSLVALLLTSACQAGELPFDFREGLAIGQIGRSARSPIRFDAVEHRLVTGVAADAARWPQAGDTVTAPDGTVRTWSLLRAATRGEGEGAVAVFEDQALAGGYLFATYESDADRTLMLESRSNGMVYVNGEPRVGDVYAYGWFRIPIRVRKGTNEFLFACGRGSLQARLLPAASDGPHFLGTDDTIPDLVADADHELPLGLVIVQPAEEPLRNAVIRIECPNGTVTTTPLPTIAGVTAFKATAMLRHRAGAAGVAQVRCALVVEDRVVAERTLDIPVVTSDARRRVTFTSAIDGSAQYYAIVPAAAGGEGESDDERGIILSLHGASVEATSQAGAYAPKSWAHVVCPTNRRAFGFDWEDWGRLDALEVLADAERRLPNNPRRRWLTGHSMGGHGTWQLGAHFAHRFAAIAPSAGWIAFSTYGGVTLSNAGPEGMFARATSASDTLALASNYARLGVYILHGDADDNVPVTQARRMRSVLAGGEGAFHRDFAYFEQPGAGHWWGNECVDWSPLMSFLRERTLRDPATIDRIDFVTAAPGVSNACDWVEIDQQVEPWQRSGLSLALDRTKRTIEGTSSNAARIALRPPIEAGPLAITLDATTIETTYDPAAPLWLVRDGERWTVGGTPDPRTKRAARGGAFKDAFRNDMVLVYGTAGDDASDAALLAKARFDAETFWYRGNGAIDLIADIDFDPAKHPDRGVILIGNAETNAAWNALLGACPILVRNGSIKFGDREFAGDDLCCVFTYPRPDSEIASVAVVAGTGPIGTRLTMRLPYFVSGVGYPDLAIIHAGTLLSGASAFRIAGFFGNDWSIERGRWSETPASP